MRTSAPESLSRGGRPGQQPAEPDADQTTGCLYMRLPGQTDRIRLDGYFSPGGFAEEDGLWPKGDTAFSGYQLLLEYFTFRDKFMFVHLNALRHYTACRSGVFRH